MAPFRAPSRITTPVVLIAFVTGAVSGGAAGLLTPLLVGYEAPGTYRAPASVQAPPEDEDRLASLVEGILPAVVSIDIKKDLRSRMRAMDEFEGFFADDEAPEGVSIGGGSGFFVSDDGIVVTNRHVIQDEDAQYEIVFQDGKRLPATVLALDPVMDLGFLHVSGTGFPTLPLGDSDRLRVGSQVIAVGNALAEFRNSVTLGVVSGKNRRIVASDYLGTDVIEEAIQTDAAINPGNSGGPLIAMDGRVVGVNTAVTDNAQSLGFALPINVVKLALQSVQREGRIVRPWLGVRYVAVDDLIATQNHLTHTQGVLLVAGSDPEDSAVLEGSPADRAGLKEGDIILALDGIVIDDAHSLGGLIAKRSPGDRVTLQVERDGRQFSVQVLLEERQPDL